MTPALWLLALAAPCWAQTELSGKLEVIVEMPLMQGAMGPMAAGGAAHEHYMGPSKLHYRLKLDDGRYVMLQGAGLDPAALKTGARLRVRGQAPIGTAAASAPAGPPQSPVDFPALSVQDFSITAPPPERPASRVGVAAAGASAVDVRTVHIVNAVPDGYAIYPPQEEPDSGIEQFYRRVSYGKLDMKVKEYWGHTTWAEASSCTMGMDSSDLPPDALDADYVVYVKGCSGACYGILGGSSSVCGAPSIHELGHNLGFQHANLLMCSNGGTKGSTPVSLADIGKDPASCTSRTYGDPNDVMGNGDGLDLLHRQRWLSAAELPAVSSNGTFTIGGIEDASAPVKGLKLVAPAGTRTLGPITVEYHPNPGAGVALRLGLLMGNYTLGLGDSQLLYAIRPQSGPYANVYDPYWQAGDRFDDPVSGLHLTILSTDATSAKVQVQWGDLPAVDKTAPTVAIVPSAQTGAAPGTVRVLVDAQDDVGVTKVELYDGQTLLQTQNPAP